MFRRVLVAIVLFLCGTVQCARILSVFPMPSHSHYKLGATLMLALAEKGHDVTMISCFVEKNAPKTFKTILLTGFAEKMDQMHKEQNMFEHANKSPFISIAALGYLLSTNMNFVIQHEKVQELLKSDEKFDVVVVEQFFNDEQKAFARHFNAPLVLFSSQGPNSWTNSLVGNPAPLSYVPDLMLEYSNTMTFHERVVNVLFKIFTDVLFTLIIRPNQNQALQAHFPNPPHLDDVLYNASLVLLNSHSSINPAVPLVPNMIEVGGLHIKPPKELPQDLKEYLDGAKDGVIYFSMGSTLHSSDLPPGKRDALLATFAKLKQKVLWKWEDQVLPGTSNVKLAKWLPQLEILAHPNVKLFITHGGYLSLTETIYHGVPVLSIPVYGDQKLNAKVAVTNGFGLTLPFDQITEESLTETISELLNNPYYRNNAKKRSELFHDRQVGPLETAIYWVEYIIRHGGAPHLRVAGVDFPWWKYHLVDVFGLFFLTAAVSFTIFIIVTTLLFKKLFGKAPKKVVKKTKSQ